MSVTVLRAIIEGQSGLSPRWLWYAISSCHRFNLFAAWYREIRTVAPRVPWLLRIWVYELLAAEQ